jgi:serine/threonine protein kinase
MAANLIGQILGNYQIEALLGAGGMGEVYRAQHLHLARPAALKVMHGNMANDPGFQARFRQEARAIASLRHPHIVDVYDFGEQDGSFYLVMELLDQGSLRSLLRHRAEAESGWSLDLALQLIAQAAEALNYAHSHGIVHRDVKPDNMLLLKTPENAWTLKISDFGLAHLAEGSIVTATGIAMGTPAYISPEQCQGTEVDGRSDLYSLGIVLYEATTGYLPFTVKTMSEAVYKHVYTAPLPPRQVCPELPETLELLILKSLAKKPEERFATGAEMAAALHAVRQGLNSPQTCLPAKTDMLEISAATVVNAASSEAQRPEMISLPGRRGTPRIQVLDAQGNSLQALDLTGDGVTIGRLPENDLALDDASVSRHHIRIDWDGVQVTVTDLGSSNGTYLENQRLTPNRTHPWKEREALHIGTFWLRLEAQNRALDPITIHSVSPQGAPVPLLVPEAVSPGSAKGVASPLAVALENETLTLTTGQPGVVQVTLANLGVQVEHLTLSVEGVPASWIQIPTQSTQLNPGMKATVALTVLAPRVPESRAGEYAVTIHVRSRDDAARTGAATGRWRVLPFVASSLVLSPTRKSGHTRAVYTVMARNEGNTPARLKLSGNDDDATLQYRFQEQALTLEPGETGSVPLTLEGSRRWIGSAQTRAFTIRSEPDAGESDSEYPVDKPHIAAGQFVHQALIPTWVPPLLIPLLALCAFGYSQWVKAHQLPPVTLPSRIQAQIISAPKGTVIPGQKLTLFGSNLGTEGILYLNGDEVTEREWKETQIVFHVPKDAPANTALGIVVTPTGSTPLDAGAVTVASSPSSDPQAKGSPPATNPTSPPPVPPRPEITQPAKGAVLPGQRIAIIGKSLGTDGTIKLGENEVATKKWSVRTITFSVPANAPTNTPLAVVVTPRGASDLDGGSVTVTAPVPPPLPGKPVIGVFKSSPENSVIADTSVMLSWEGVRNADKLELDDGAGNRQEVTGSSYAVKPHIKTTYTLTATGKGGTEQKTVAVAVIPGIPIPTLPANNTVIRTLPRPGVFYIRPYMPYEVTFQWNPVDFAGGVTYMVETQWTDGSTWTPMPPCLAVSDTHYLVNYLGKSGITGARWRVHVSSATAGDGPPSDWWSLTFSNAPWFHLPPPKVDPGTIKIVKPDKSRSNFNDRLKSRIKLNQIFK